MPIAQDHDMIQAFSPGRADEPFDVSVRPEPAGRSWSVPDAHRLGLTPEKLPRLAAPEQAKANRLPGPRVSG